MAFLGLLALELMRKFPVQSGAGRAMPLKCDSCNHVLCFVTFRDVQSWAYPRSWFEANCFVFCRSHFAEIHAERSLIHHVKKEKTNSTNVGVGKKKRVMASGNAGSEESNKNAKTLRFHLLAMNRATIKKDEDRQRELIATTGHMSR